MIEDIVAKINVMSLDEIQPTREILSMTQYIDDITKDYLYDMLDKRENKLIQSFEIEHSEVKPDEIGLI